MSATPSAGANGRAPAGRPPPFRAADGRPALQQDVRFCTSRDGTRIAYALSGHGPPLVFPATYQTHATLDPTLLGYRHWLEGLSKHHTLIRSDLRGSGLSDWDLPSMEFGDFVADLEAMVDDAGLDRFPMFALSHSTQTAIAYAVRHPERVSHLILFAASARAFISYLKTEEHFAQHEAYRNFLFAFWNSTEERMRTFFTSDVVPAASREIVAALDEVRRRSMTPENALRAIDTIARVDVTELLPRIKIPTLVLQPLRGSPVSVKTARQVAAAIPNARLILLEADNHLIQEYEPGWPALLEETWSFLGMDGAARAASDHSNGNGANGARGPELSGREREVLCLIAQHKSNAEIAEALTISHATASKHVHNILGKLDMKRRGEAAAWAVRQGLVD